MKKNQAKKVKPKIKISTIKEIELVYVGGYGDGCCCLVAECVRAVPRIAREEEHVFNQNQERTI